MSQVSFSSEDEVLQNKINKLAEKFNDKLIDLIKEFSVKGELEPNDDLSKLDINILEALKSSGLIQMYEYMQTIIQKLNIENISYYSKLSKIQSDIRSSKSVNYVLDNLKSNLIGQNIKSVLAQQIANTIRPLVLSNADYSTTRQALSKVIPQQINRYLGQITKGAFSVYDGAIQQSIGEKYGLTEGFYINDLQENSRPFCIHMKNKYGSNPIKISELQNDLDEYCPNGIPSDDKITIDGKQYKKGAGMMKLTTVKTFPLFKGGAENNCHHKWRWNIQFTK